MDINKITNIPLNSYHMSKAIYWQGRMKWAYEEGVTSRFKTYSKNFIKALSLAANIKNPKLIFKQGKLKSSLGLYYERRNWIVINLEPHKDPKFSKFKDIFETITHEWLHAWEQDKGSVFWLDTQRYYFNNERLFSCDGIRFHKRLRYLMKFFGIRHRLKYNKKLYRYLNRGRKTNRCLSSI